VISFSVCGRIINLEALAPVRGGESLFSNKYWYLLRIKEIFYAERLELDKVQIIETLIEEHDYESSASTHRFLYAIGLGISRLMITSNLIPLAPLLQGNRLKIHTVHSR
jgi:hypothetical protein